MKIKLLMLLLSLTFSMYAAAQPTADQIRNARATGYAIIAAKNPGASFSVYMIPWDGVNTLEHNANTQINPNWHAQAAIKGNFFYQGFDGSDFSIYSTVVTSQAEFDLYKSTGTQWWIACSNLPSFSNQSITANQNGDVGIGTTTPREKLSVNGKVRAHEVKVEITNWPDYVFEPGYSLPDLERTEEFIKQNKHLPGIPSAAEAESTGIAIGEMNGKLLKKIEELTLYLIAQQKVMEEQNKRIKGLEAKIK